ncbi:ribonuclease H-like protein [Cucurbitaria berberidis CBS 394.84]|uniref:ribonuclease H n=1 Tax=Cucurbitaria berberidis CBS 394.84 TaxID=1168544 RepID=A0A9P4GEG4_9PLEO|nr:ribonuclease H-like protein [Cucurbitaria berberidis CBS 394.84]KAF1844503.1 ribonuclease H-like protein [Cucurbitaria berberidis CBS 394.84]
MVKGAGSPSAKSGKTKYYGVAVGHVPGVYTDYATVQAQTKGCMGGKQKGFATRAEAQAFVDNFKRPGSTPISLRGDLSESSSLAAGKPSNLAEGTPKRQKKEHTLPVSALTNGNIKYEPGWGPLPPGAEDGFDRTIKLDPEGGNIRTKTEEELSATKMQPTGDISGPIVVYTDGSSLGNGRVGAVGGVGVYFGPNDPRNVSEALRGNRQTNQRAELTAIARALDHIAIDREARIVTDSNYSIKCLTEWFPKWVERGWKNSSGKDVENRDLIEPIIARIRERDMSRAKTKFQWIKGHANDPGNVAADALAVRGSRYSTPDLRNAREFSETLNTPTRAHYRMQPKKQPGADAKPVSVALDDEDEFDEIFATLAAEHSADQVAETTVVQAGVPLSEAVKQVTEAAIVQDGVPPSVAAQQLAKAAAKEGQEHLEQTQNGDAPEVKASEENVSDDAEKMDTVQESVERA